MHTERAKNKEKSKFYCAINHKEKYSISHHHSGYPLNKKGRGRMMWTILSYFGAMLFGAMLGVVLMCLIQVKR